MGRLPEDMLLLLTNAGLSTASLYHSNMPDKPNELVFVDPTASLAPQEVHEGGPIRKPGFQVICRSTQWETAWDNAHIAWNAFRDYNVVINGSNYLAIQPVQEPMNLGKDENERRLVGFNVQVNRE
jgi:hypothetical protein